MKGATEVPSTITVIIIQYTLIKRMKCELAFPISPTYSLNFKYSSHGLSPWKHTGTVGVSHMATPPLLQEWRNGGIWREESKKHENNTDFSYKSLLRLPGKSSELLSRSHSFLVPSLFPGTGMRSSATALRIRCHWPPLDPKRHFSESRGVSHTPEEWVQLSSKGEKVQTFGTAKWNQWNRANSPPPAEPGNLLKCLFSPLSPGNYPVFDFIFPRNISSPVTHCLGLT